MLKLKNAPNVNKQPKGKPHEAYIIAGSEAWNKEKKLTVLEWTKADQGYEPIILGSKELREIDRLKLAVEVGKVSIYRAGTLKEAEKSAICRNLAKYSTAEIVAFYDEAIQLEENASGYIARLRAEIGNAGGNTPTLKEKDSTNEKARAFIKWLSADLALQRATRQVYAYDGKIWNKFDDEDLEESAVRFMDENEFGYSDKTINSLVNTLKIQLPRMGETANELIAFNNGVLNRNTLTFEPHSRNNWLISCVPHNYDQEQTKTPLFDKWLDFVSEGNLNKSRNILAALYAILTNRHNWQVFFEVTGKGGSGKSVFASIATLLAGEKNTAAGRLDSFDDERKLEGFENKTLILCPEQSKYAGDGSGLKAISGGDPVNINPKYMKPFKAKIPALIMLINNETCRFTERSGGIERRRVIFSFQKCVPEKERDPYFMDKITLEIGGILRKVLDAFPDPLDAKKALAEQMNSQEALEAKMLSDPMTAFFEYFYTTEAINGLYIGSATMPQERMRTHLYPAYLAYVRAMNIAELGLNNFVLGIEQAIKQHGNIVEFAKRKTNAGKRTNIHFKKIEDFLNDILN